MSGERNGWPRSLLGRYCIAADPREDGGLAVGGERHQDTQTGRKKKCRAVNDGRGVGRQTEADGPGGMSGAEQQSSRDRGERRRQHHAVASRGRQHGVRMAEVDSV